MANNWKDFCISQIPKMKARFKQMTGREPDLINPKRFTDKLEWLKAYDSIFLKTMCADKILVRDYVKEKLGKDISIPLLGVYDKFDDIDFSKLPKDYIMKTNHGSQTNIIVRNGQIDKKLAKRKFAEWLSKDWTWWGYEMFYMPIHKKILIEEYMKNEGKSALTDYKFSCFNSEPKFCQIINDRFTNKLHINYYNMNFKPMLDVSRNDHPANYSLKDEKPETWDLMIEYAKKLSEDFKYVRVDFYQINGKIYFGELTFIPAAAYIKYKNDKTDFEFGEMLKL